MVAEPKTTRKIWTYAEVRALNDDVLRELHEGEIWIVPSPTFNHQRIVTRLAGFLNDWAKQHGGGEATVSPLDMYVSERSYYIPDLIFYSGPQMEIIEAEGDLKNLRMAPHVAVEVLSPSTARNDRTLKTRAYAAFGIAHYWILDPVARTLEAFELGEGRYFLAGAIGSGETLDLSSFPGLNVPADELFPGTPAAQE